MCVTQCSERQHVQRSANLCFLWDCGIIVSGTRKSQERKKQPLEKYFHFGREFVSGIQRGQIYKKRRIIPACRTGRSIETFQPLPGALIRLTVAGKGSPYSRRGRAVFWILRILRFSNRVFYSQNYRGGQAGCGSGRAIDITPELWHQNHIAFCRG